MFDDIEIACDSIAILAQRQAECRADAAQARQAQAGTKLGSAAFKAARKAQGKADAGRSINESAILTLVYDLLLGDELTPFDAADWKREIKAGEKCAQVTCIQARASDVLASSMS